MNVISSPRNPLGPNDADNFTHCFIEYKILDSSQHEEDPAPQLGKPVPFPAEDIPSLSQTLIPPKSGYQSLMDASTVPTPATPFDPMNPIFPPLSVACDSFSKQLAVNITSCRDADSSTVRPYAHTSSDYELIGQMVHMASIGTQPLASIPSECHPLAKFWGSISSHKANIIRLHDDTLGVDQGMGFPHMGLNFIPINMIPESSDDILAPKEMLSLGCPKLVDEDLEDNVHHTSTAAGEYISPPTSSLKVHLPPTAKDLCPVIDPNDNFLGTDVNGNYLEVDINAKFNGGSDHTF